MSDEDKVVVSTGISGRALRILLGMILFLVLFITYSPDA